MDPSNAPPEADSTHSESRRIVRSAVLVGALTLLSRVAGLLREATIGVFLGTGVMADAFRIGFTLPNLMRRLVGEGAVTSAFVAVYSRHVDHESHDAAAASQDGIVFAEKVLTLWVLLVAAPAHAVAEALTSAKLRPRTRAKIRGTAVLVAAVRFTVTSTAFLGVPPGVNTARLGSQFPMMTSPAPTDASG